MPRDWVVQAVIGTDNLHDVLIAAVHDDVRWCSSHDVQIDQHLIEQFAYYPDNPLSQSALYYLNLIAKDVYWKALPEWLQTVIECGYDPTIESIELLVKKFQHQRDNTWYPLATQFLGKTGTEIGKMMFCEDALSIGQQKLLAFDVDELLRAKASRDETITENTRILSVKGASDLHKKFMSMRWPWTPEFTKVYLQTSLEHSSAFYMLADLDYYPYFLSLNFDPDDLNNLFAQWSHVARAELEFANKATQKVSGILAFRRRMIADITRK